MSEGHVGEGGGLNPVAKLLGLILLSILVVMIASPVIMAVFVAVVLSAKRYFRTRGLFTKGVMGFALAIFVAQLIFNHSGDEVYSVSVLKVTTGGISSGIAIAGKFLSLIMMSWIFVATTKPSDLSSALIGVGVPYRYGYLPALAMRFVPVFEIELNSVREAQVVRGLKLDRSLKGLIRSAKYTVLPMFFTAMFKVNSLAASMTGRGFGAHRQRTLLHPLRVTRWDAAFVVSTLAAVALFVILQNCADLSALSLD